MENVETRDLGAGSVAGSGKVSAEQIAGGDVQQVNVNVGGDADRAGGAAREAAGKAAPRPAACRTRASARRTFSALLEPACICTSPILATCSAMLSLLRDAVICTGPTLAAGSAMARVAAQYRRTQPGASRLRGCVKQEPGRVCAFGGECEQCA